MPIPKGYKFSEARNKNISEKLKGKPRLDLIGKIPSIQTKEKMSKTRKNIWKDPEYRRLQIEKVTEGQKRTFDRIDQESDTLRSQGFKTIPIGRVIPDIIAIKDGKVYAVEVEYGIPNYSKYDKNGYGKNFDDVIWIIRKK